MDTTDSGPSLWGGRVLALLNGPLYAMVAGLATLFVIPGFCASIGRRTGMEMILFVMIAAGLALLAGLIGGVAAIAVERTAERLMAAVGKLWKWQLIALPVMVGLMLAWELAIDPVIC